MKYKTQELIWIRELLNKDIAINKDIAKGENPPQIQALASLRVENMEGLREKTQQMIDRSVKQQQKRKQQEK